MAGFHLPGSLSNATDGRNSPANDTMPPGNVTTSSTVLLYESHNDSVNSTSGPPIHGGLGSATVIGLSVAFCLTAVLVLVSFVCARKRKSLKSAFRKGIPVNFKRSKSGTVDRAPLTTLDSDPTMMPDGLPVYHDEEIIRRPLKSALRPQNQTDVATDRYPFTDSPKLDRNDSGVANRSSRDSTNARYADDNRSNHDFDWDEFFSDEVYKKTDFSDTATKQANAELSPGHDSGLDVNGLEGLLDDEFDFEWTSAR